MSTLEPERADELHEAVAERERIEREIAALNATADRGIGQRTARLSNLSAWEAARARADRRIDELSGGRARDARGDLDLDAVRALIDRAQRVED
jgi:hypothetical protein